MEIYIIVDLHFQGIFSRYPIRYIDGIHHRLVNIDFADMDKDEYFAFIERFTKKKCKKI